MATLVAERREAADGVTGPLRIVAGRLDSVDLLRGLIMVVMTLDHVRDFFKPSPEPTDLAHSDVLLFFTRWVTHFCAPTFMFLAGTGAYLAGLRKTRGQLAWFLITRGLWLVVLEITIVRCLGWAWNFDFHWVGGVILWAIGLSMVCLAALSYLPTWLVAVFGLAMIGSHNAFDHVKPAELGDWGWLWRILHAGGDIEWRPGWHFGALYPLVPWIGVMAVGYAFGSLFLLRPATRRPIFFVLGVALTAGFVCLRYSNVYGDPNPWSPQRNEAMTVCSFLNCHKYPPSLCYLLMTLGPVIAALAFFDREPGPVARRVIVFGRVPLFFYLIHVPVIHALAAVVAYAYYGPSVLAWNQPPPDYGYSLATVYAVWVLVVVMLYPPCLWFAGVKRRRRDAWLSYL